MAQHGGSSISDPWTLLVISMLSVNNYSLEKCFQIKDALNDSGLFDVDKISSMSAEEIAQNLVMGGYDRGLVMTAIFTERVSSLRSLAEKKDIVERVLREGTAEEIEACLKGVKGVGPSVIRNFLLLRE